MEKQKTKRSKDGKKKEEWKRRGIHEHTYESGSWRKKIRKDGKRKNPHIQKRGKGL